MYLKKNSFETMQRKTGNYWLPWKPKNHAAMLIFEDFVKPLKI
jgi:hypothetical protein